MKITDLSIILALGLVLATASVPGFRGMKKKSRGVNIEGYSYEIVYFEGSRYLKGYQGALTYAPERKLEPLPPVDGDKPFVGRMRNGQPIPYPNQ